MTRTTPQSPKKQPSRHARQTVADAFDGEALKHLCTTWDFTSYADRIDLKPHTDWMGRESERFYWYKDNGSKILAVAHLDTVQDDRSCQITSTAGGLLATSGALDDRLGVYVILELLPRLGITCDWLLTTDEEAGESTADEFSPPEGKEYNWIIEFDRGGTDVVMYQYETPELVELVRDAGARVGTGSFSDIAVLDFLECAAFNWGVGYEDYHSERGHAWLDDTFRMVARFVKFYEANHDTYLAYERGWGELNAEVVADCGDLVDLSDKSSYFEAPDGLILCTAYCAPLDDVLEPIDDGHDEEAPRSEATRRYIESVGVVPLTGPA